jgi:hypothetical protein
MLEQLPELGDEAPKRGAELLLEPVNRSESEHMRPIVWSASLPAIKQFPQLSHLLVSQPTSKFLGCEPLKYLLRRQPPQSLFRGHPPQSLFGGDCLQHRHLQFLFQLTHVFDTRVLHRKLLTFSPKLLDLLQDVRAGA